MNPKEPQEYYFDRYVIHDANIHLGLDKEASLLAVSALWDKLPEGAFNPSMDVFLSKNEQGLNPHAHLGIKYRIKATPEEKEKIESIRNELGFVGWLNARTELGSLDTIITTYDMYQEAQAAQGQTTSRIGFI